MPSLINDIFGLGEKSSGSRPQMLETNGINYNTDQASNLVAAFPMWEPANATMISYGPVGLKAFPRLQNVLKTRDSYLGNVSSFDGTARPYVIPYSTDLDFGLGPSPFSVTFWMKITGAPAAIGFIVMNDGPASAFPGYFVGASTASQIFFGTANTNAPDVRDFTSTTGFFDNFWHHWAFTHVPAAAGATAGATSSIYVDGVLNARSAGRASVGPTQGAQTFFGTDDDGLGSPFGVTAVNPALVCDLRFYSAAISGDRAAQMFHPDTRWDLWQPTRKMWFFNPNASGPPPTARASIFGGGILNSPLISSGGICS